MDHLIFPRFWSEKPALWFAQVEAVFALNGVIEDSDKYDYILTELNSEIISLLEDIILNPAEQDVESKYANIKYETIKRLSIQQLTKEELGTMKPSEFLQHLRHKADVRVPEETIKRVWLQRLPNHVKEIVSVESSNNMEVLSEMADKVMNVIPIIQSTEPTLAPVIDITTCLEKLSVQLVNVQNQLEKIQAAFQLHRVSPCKSCKSQSESKDNIKQPRISAVGGNCWYHTNFGDKAVKCIGPCAYKEKLHETRELFNVTSF